MMQCQLVCPNLCAMLRKTGMISDMESAHRSTALITQLNLHVLCYTFTATSLSESRIASDMSLSSGTALIYKVLIPSHYCSQIASPVGLKFGRPRSACPNFDLPSSPSQVFNAPRYLVLASTRPHTPAYHYDNWELRVVSLRNRTVRLVCEESESDREICGSQGTCESIASDGKLQPQRSRRMPRLPMAASKWVQKCAVSPIFIPLSRRITAFQRPVSTVAP